MARFDKQALLDALDVANADEEKSFKERTAKWEREYARWRKDAARKFAQYVENHDPDHADAQNWRTLEQFEPPRKPTNRGCSRAAEARARIALIAENKAGVIVVSDKDPALSFIRCHNGASA